MTVNRPPYRQRLRAERERIKRELVALEIELMRHDVHKRFMRSFPNAAVGYPLYDQ